MARETVSRLQTLSHAEVIRRVQRACDDLVERATRGHAPPVSCRTGCDHCCKQPVFITPLEGVATREYVDRNGLTAEVARRIARYREQISARRMGTEGYNTLLRNVRGQGPPPSERQRRAVYGVHCPFLEDHRCLIYPARPLMCREHVSFDDPRKCERDEPFLGLDKPRFAEVSAYLTMRDVPPKGQTRPVTEFREAAEDADKARAVPASEVKKALRWKTGG